MSNDVRVRSGRRHVTSTSECLKPSAHRVMRAYVRQGLTTRRSLQFMLGRSAWCRGSPGAPARRAWGSCRRGTHAWPCRTPRSHALVMSRNMLKLR